MFDERGNVVERLDSSGAVLTRHAYTAYGRDYTNTNPSNLNLLDEPWGFGAQYGYYTDRETNYIYCTFRYYDPQLGRWLNRDPAGYGGGLNLYKYCSNNPINHIDPLGLSPDDPYDFTEGDIPTSNAQMYARAGSDFANDKMWKGGSCQRKEFSQGISMIPVVGEMNQAVIAATGYDYIAGEEVGGLQRGLAIVGTAMAGASAADELNALFGFQPEIPETYYHYSSADNLHAGGLLDNMGMYVTDFKAGIDAQANKAAFNLFADGAIYRDGAARFKYMYKVTIKSSFWDNLSNYARNPGKGGFADIFIWPKNPGVTIHPPVALPHY